ncbi:uncharacterized protein LOC111055258 [Nilaparvata lugens]|uniref:uncharacterized protein LOC111055258 n=1 Tax=Nilaparvata lugens TaxID=108931 RepID=UPI00193E2411|nr:uncharacterized protein LOC111055258 [Nilaparvata lugens]
MYFNIRLLVTFSTLGSILVLTNAVVEESEVTIGKINDILYDSYAEASVRLLGEAVLYDPNFKDFLGGKTVQQFHDDKKFYDIFQSQLDIYYVGYLFFNTYPLLKDSVTSFAADWVKQNPKNEDPADGYTVEFKKVLKKDATKNKDKINLVESFDSSPPPEDLNMIFEQVLKSRVSLAETKAAGPQKDNDYFDKLFAAVEAKKFENSLDKYTEWRRRLLADLENVQLLVRKLYASFSSLDAFEDEDEDYE